MFTSSGLHTFTIFLKTTLVDARALYDAFQGYSEVDVFKIDRTRKVPVENDFLKFLCLSKQLYYKIYYKDKLKGISWEIRYNSKSPKFIDRSVDEDKPCSIKAQINPKVFIGIKDYVSASNRDMLEQLEIAFNTEAAKISPILGRFDMYGLNRLDYCINFDLNELKIDCPPALIMKLIQHSNIPKHYSEYMKYDKNSHRKKTGENSYYLKSKSANINVYWKLYQLQKSFADCPNIDDSLDVIRFEPQLKYPKIYSMTKTINNKSRLMDLLQVMLSDEVCADVLSRYFDKVIRRGDYYTLDQAKRIVESHHFAPKKEDRLINTLSLINKCRGISKAKAALKGEELEDFRRTLRELAEIGVNPVTIPKEWGIKQIPNLMNAYYRKIEDERSKKQADERRLEMVQEFYHCL